MEKRVCERIPVNIEAGFSYNDSFYYGIVTNISEKGMCINTRMRLFFNSSVELLIISKEEGLNVPAKVSCIVMMTDSFSDAMGVEVLNPAKKYLEFVDSLRHVCKP